MKYHIFLLLLLFSLSYSLSAQDNRINEYAGIRFDKSLQFGAIKHSNGLGLNTQYLIQRKVNRLILFNYEIISLKHPKESKVVNPIEDQALPYVYGKRFSAIPMRFGAGNQFIVADKETPSGIRISLNYHLGLDMTLLKPQYLWITYYFPETGRVKKLEKYDPENPVHANQNNIFGGAAFYHGFTDLETVFGLYLKTSISFEWNDSEDQYKLIETGFMIDAFPEPLPIFAYIDNSNLFFNFFVSLSFGKRW